MAHGSEKANANILKWIGREEWSEPFGWILADHLGPPCEEFDIDVEDLPEEIGPDLFDMALACVLDDFLTCVFEPDDRNPIEQYLKRRGWKESATGKRYLQALRQSVMSLYEVTDAVPGRHLYLRDLVRGGDAIRVEDRAGSESVVKWDRIAARVLQVNGKNHLAPGLLHFPMEIADELLDSLHKALKQARREVKRSAGKSGSAPVATDQDMDGVMLGELAPLFTRWWIDSVLAALRQPMPEIRNFDGDEVVFCETRFPLGQEDADEVVRRLDAVGELERDDEAAPRWQWIGDGKPDGRRTGKTEADDSGKIFSIGSFHEGGQSNFGMVELHGTELLLTTNSRERATRGQTLLTTWLGELVAPPSTSFRSIESMVTDSPESRESDGPAVPLPADEAAPIIHGYLDQHYHDCMTREITALGGKTPRQAARSKSGRVKLVQWLKQLENSEARRARDQGEIPYDTAWMWQELGLSELRR